MELVSEPSPADWIGPALLPWGPRGLAVGSIVPTGFEAYARILHPATTWTEGDPPVSRRIRWADVSAWSGVSVQPGFRFERIERRADDVRWTNAHDRVGGPDEGELPEEMTRALVEVLTPHTTTPGVAWFCVWEGWGYFRVQNDPGVRVRLPARNYLLFRGPLHAIVNFQSEDPRFFVSPALWWPDDRAWLIATEIDFESTFVGGSAEAVDAVLRAETLEAVPTAVDDLSEVAEGFDPGD